MILRRLIAQLRAQDWVATGIEFVLVVLGVYLGILAANWNEQRGEREQTQALLRQIQPELNDLRDFSNSARAYYATTRNYAETAFAGWAGDSRVVDRDFIIAAYQASQVYGFGNNGASWALVFGGGELRKIENPRIRVPLTRLMTFEYDRLNYSSVESEYRDEVRQVIPDEIQQRIRAQCGDRINPANQTSTLPARCGVAIAPDEAAQVAGELRRRTDLPQRLRLHLAGVSAYLINLDIFDGQRSLLAREIAALET